MIRSKSFAALALTLAIGAPVLAGPDSYVRFTQEGQDGALQTAVAHFTHPDSKVEIVLNQPSMRSHLSKPPAIMTPHSKNPNSTSILSIGSSSGKDEHSEDSESNYDSE